MPSLIGIPQLLSAALVFCRIAAALRMLPFFGGNPLPVSVWAGLSFAVTVAIAPSVPAVQPPGPWTGLAALAAKELFIGFLIGTTGRILFSVLENAGRLARPAMFASPFDAADDAVVRLYVLVGIVTLLLLDGHHTFLRGLAVSFRCAPPDVFPNALLSGSNAVLAVFSSAVATAVLLCVPLFAAGLAADWILTASLRLLTDTSFSASDGIRALVVQATMILIFSGTVRVSMQFILAGLEKLTVCAPV